MTDTNPTPPTHAESVAATIEARRTAAENFAAAARATMESLPLDVYVWEDIDGVAVAVPQSTRDAFIAEHRSRRDAAMTGALALEVEIGEFSALSPLERVRRWPNTDERAALARLAAYRSPV